MHLVLPATPVAVPLLVAAILAALNRHIPRWAADTLAITATIYCGVSSLLLVRYSSHQPIVYWFGGWTPHNGIALGISFVIDPLGAGLAAFVALLVLASFVFSLHYFDTVGVIYHALMLAFLAAMTGFSLTGDLFNMFVFFELMSVAAFALCGYKIEEAGPLQGSLNFAVTNSLGAFLVLSGLGLLYGRTGALNMAQIGRSLAAAHDALVIVAFVFITCGFLVKAAAAPFHFWLGDAHAVAPTPVCILFSGVMVELGLYAVARVYWTVFHASLAPYAGNVRAVFAALGTLTAIVGGLMSFSERHIKRLLAFSTVSHMGLMIIGFGMLNPRGLAGTAIYVVGHGAVKGSLFMAAGILLHRLGSIDEQKLYGRGRQIPGIAGLILLFTIGLASLPPFGTFLGESMIMHAGEQFGYSWLKFVFFLAEVLTAGAILRVLGHVYYGWGPKEDRAGPEEGETDERRETKGPHNVPVVMWLPMLMLLAVGAGLAFLPGIREHVLTCTERFQDQSGYAATVLNQVPMHLPTPPERKPLAADVVHGIVVAVAAALLALAALFRNRLPLLKRVDSAEALTLAMKPLRLVHSGMVTDYVAWLVFGVAVIGGAFAYLLR